MDIVYMRVGNGSARVDGNGSGSFIEENLGTALPYLIVLSACATGGVFGNLLVIGAVISDKALRAVGNMFVVNLAAADLCVTVFVNPFSIVGIILGEAWFERRYSLCVFVTVVCTVSCFCSLLNIMLVGVNRYFFICRFQQYSKLYTVRNTVAMCVGAWVLSGALEFPNHFGLNGYRMDGKSFACVWDRLHPNPYMVVVVSASVLGPTAVISFCYIQIYRRVTQSRDTAKGENKTTDKDQDNSVKLARTLFIIFFVFVACWSPYLLIVLADRKDELPQPVHLYALLFAHLNSSVNPLIYGLTNRQFRRAYLRLLRLRRCQGQVGPDDRTSTTLSFAATSTKK